MCIHGSSHHGSRWQILKYCLISSGKNIGKRCKAINQSGSRIGETLGIMWQYLHHWACMIEACTDLQKGAATCLLEELNRRHKVVVQVGLGCLLPQGICHGCLPEISLLQSSQPLPQLLVLGRAPIHERQECLLLTVCASETVTVEVAEHGMGLHGAACQITLNLPCSRFLPLERSLLLWHWHRSIHSSKTNIGWRSKNNCGPRDL